MRKAFTLMELIIVIAIIGILTSIAVPKFAATRDDATITKARSTISNIRASLSAHIQKNILKADYKKVHDLGGTVNGHDEYLFDYFYDEDGNRSDDRVLEYPPRSCKNQDATGCWMRTGDREYSYKLPHSVRPDDEDVVKFQVTDEGRFVCYNDEFPHGCKLLDR